MESFDIFGELVHGVDLQVVKDDFNALFSLEFLSFKLSLMTLFEFGFRACCIEPEHIPVLTLCIVFLLTCKLVP